MRRPPAYDRGSFQAEIWKRRLRWFARAGGFALDLLHSVWLVAFASIVGAIAGVVIGALWGTDRSFWGGLIAGGALGAAGGVAWARRVFFSEPRPKWEPLPEPAPGAPRWPGVQEEFRRLSARLRVLVVLLFAAFLLLCYLRAANEFKWPVPFSLPPAMLAWGLLAFVVVLFLLMLLTIRCPKCRGILWRAAELHQCPHCGVVLREP